MRITKEGNSRVVFEGAWECEFCGAEWHYDETDDKPGELARDQKLNTYRLPCPTCQSPVSREVPKLSDSPA